MLNVEVFFALADVRDKLERWRQDYNRASYYPSGYVIEKLRFCWRESCPAGV